MVGSVKNLVENKTLHYETLLRLFKEKLMIAKHISTWILPLVLLSNNAFAKGIQMKPFAIDWRDNSDSLVDLSFLLDVPAGKEGFVRAKNGHLVKPNGERFRLWGVNFTFAACFPSKEDAPVVAAHLARFGINCVRFHFLDSKWSGLFVRGSDSTRALDPNQLDRLDYFIAELKKQGIYTNLNLNVGRNYRKGDGVKNYQYLGFAKVVNYFDEHIKTLHKEYARQLLTHYNPYTKSEYRNEPAVLIVELVNENSIVEAWFSDRLLGKNMNKHPGTWTDITSWYANQLTKKYNAWLKERLSSAELKELRKMAGVKDNELIPRLTRNQFSTAPKKRFHLEATFYMELEQNYFEEMYRYLKEEIGVKSLIVGTSDHNHWKTGYPLLTSTSQLDVVDGHVYWQYPGHFTDPKTGKRSFRIENRPMVNNPFNSTIVQLSRSAMAGKPYTISETNHPFPNEYACEGIGVLAAYSAFHDWDGVFFHEFDTKDPNRWSTRISGHFDIRPDPVKMTNLAACAIMFLRADIRSAVKTIPRSYSMEQVREGIRYPYSERPYFTSGFQLWIPLQHTTRIVNFDGQPQPYPKVGAESPIVSDTGELKWYHSQAGKGLVTIETEKSQALIGFVKDNNKVLKNISAKVENEFCSIIVTSLDRESIARSQSLLLVTTARSANKGMTWNEDRTSLSNWGSEPTVIEPVKGNITLRNLRHAERLEAVPLNGAGKTMGESIILRKVKEGFVIPVGEPATTWYLVRIQR